ncbi:uncharacterized protein [Amphiura filiformis]|uniref:uncharacterized protein n=1 Tax=Amphiura filiformis TaxID=82378 RepID=UPI003B226AF1
MRNAALLQPIGASTRNFGVGDLPITGSRSVSSHGVYSSNFSSPSKTTSRVPSYTEDFTDSATQPRTRSDHLQNRLPPVACLQRVSQPPSKNPKNLFHRNNFLHPYSIKTASDLSVSSALGLRTRRRLRRWPMRRLGRRRKRLLPRARLPRRRNTGDLFLTAFLIGSRNTNINTNNINDNNIVQ